MRARASQKAPAAATLLLPFRIVADHPRLLLPLSILLFLIALIGTMILLGELKKYPGGTNTPDLRVMGYTVAELNQYYDNLGVEGCRSYVSLANWDFFPVMPSYIVTLGALHVLSARKLKIADRGAYLLLLVFLFDIVETFLQRRGAVLYPDRLSTVQILLASACCSLKSLSLFLSILQLLVGGFKIVVQKRDQKNR